MKDVSVVLAHGAWADGSSWAGVIAALKKESVEGSAAPLPLKSLADDMAALNRSLDRTEGPIVLADTLTPRREAAGDVLPGNCIVRFVAMQHHRGNSWREI